MDIEARRFQRRLFVFEGAGFLHVVADAQEEGDGVGRQVPAQFGEQGLEIEGGDVAVQPYRRHAGAAVGVGNFHAVGHGFADVVTAVHDPFHLGGGDVLAFPAKGVAQPVHKLGVLEPDVAHQVAAVEPGVALLEDVGQDAFLSLFRVGVPVEGGLVGDLANEQASFAFAYTNHAAFAVANGRLVFLVVSDDGVREGAHPHRVVEIEQVGKADVALAGGIELHDLGNSEALFEGFPDGGAQTITDDHPDLIGGVLGGGRLIHQVAAKLTHIAEGRGAVVTDVLPESAGTEAPGDDQARVTRQYGTPVSTVLLKDLKSAT